MRSRSIDPTRGKSSSALPTVGSIERLQMARDTYHEPVMVAEIVELFAQSGEGWIVDATVGGGGHAAALLASSADLRVVGLDRDPQAREAARTRLAPFGERARIGEGTFATMGRSVEALGVSPQEVVGVLMDLGVSSHQLDDPSRGFTFREDVALDMRMDPTRGPTAALLIEQIDEGELSRLLARHGEPRFARALARAMKSSHPATTGQLVAVVEGVIPPSHRRRGHVATRVFQALRVAVNAEEEQLDLGLAEAHSLLVAGATLAVISYHSGEDRVVKAFLAQAQSGGCTCPPQLGCVCGARGTVRVGRSSARLATPAEIASNPRARSARLRWAVRVAA